MEAETQGLQKMSKVELKHPRSWEKTQGVVTLMTARILVGYCQSNAWIWEEGDDNNHLCHDPPTATCIRQLPTLFLIRTILLPDIQAERESENWHGNIRRIYEVIAMQDGVPFEGPRDSFPPGDPFLQRRTRWLGVFTGGAWLRRCLYAWHWFALMGFPLPRGEMRMMDPSKWLTGNDLWRSRWMQVMRPQVAIDGDFWVIMRDRDGRGDRRADCNRDRWGERQT